MYTDISSAKLVVNPVVDPKQSLLQFYSVRIVYFISRTWNDAIFVLTYTLVFLIYNEIKLPVFASNGEWKNSMKNNTNTK